jgi:hypothetical protein
LAKKQSEPLRHATPGHFSKAGFENDSAGELRRHTRITREHASWALEQLRRLGTADGGTIVDMAR